MEADEIIGEISYHDVQEMVDQMLGTKSFSFTEYLSDLVQGEVPFSSMDILQDIFQGVIGNLAQERRLYLSLILIAVVGAVLSNFSKLLQGKQVAETAFYALYLLFFSIMMSLFVQTSQIAEQTLTKLLDFMKVLTPAYFITMGFTESAMAAGAYYEFTLVLIMLVDAVLVKFAIPAIQIFFLLRIADQFSGREMFSKMAELIQDVVNFVMKTMFGLMMGFNVIQGLILPVALKLKTSSVVKLSSAILGVGSVVSSVTSTVLCAGTLVKNAVGITGVIVVVFFCGVPLLRLVLSRFLFQLVGAIVQPVSDNRIVACFSAAKDSIKMLAYALSVGSMMFVITITLISAMTG
ncbi:MAG: stage III sporulation protein AE [Lachnospiraceae bacterium]|nr:stage III sporulation protein AE [Lachnospiraceae bacterium]